MAADFEQTQRSIEALDEIFELADGIAARATAHRHKLQREMGWSPEAAEGMAMTLYCAVVSAHSEGAELAGPEEPEGPEV